MAEDAAITAEKLISHIIRIPSLIGARPMKRGFQWLEAIPLAGGCCASQGAASMPTALDSSSVPGSPFPGCTKIRIQATTIYAPPDVSAAAISTIQRSLNPSLSPLQQRRQLLVLINPWSGARKAPHIWRTQVEPVLRDAGFTCLVVQSTHSGHIKEVGTSYFDSYCNDRVRVEGVIIVGGDGTINEFVNGVSVAAEKRARLAFVHGYDHTFGLDASVAQLLADFSNVRVCAISCGTSNALAVGLRTTQPEFAAWCVIRGRTRPLDALEIVNGAGQRALSLCGIGWGVAAAIAHDSEAYRWLGTSRYAFLKLKHGAATGLGISEYPAVVRWGLAEDLFPTPAFGSTVTSDFSPTSFRSPPAVSTVSSAASCESTPLVSPSSVRSSPRAFSSCGSRCSQCSGMLGRQRAAVSTLAKEIVSTSKAGGSPALVGEGSQGPATKSEGLRESVAVTPAPVSIPIIPSAPLQDRAQYITVGVVNTAPDARFGHASDGCLDLILARRGGIVDTSGLLFRYVGRFAGVSDERNSVLYDYVKTSAVCIEPLNTQNPIGCNVDGEAFPAPGPFRVRVLPSLLVVFGEL